jgi:hypothetical protein
VSPREEGTGITLNGGAVPNEHLDSGSFTNLCHRFAMSKLVSQSVGGERLTMDVEKHRRDQLVEASEPRRSLEGSRGAACLWTEQRRCACDAFEGLEQHEARRAESSARGTDGHPIGPR